MPTHVNFFTTIIALSSYTFAANINRYQGELMFIDCLSVS